MSANTTTSNCRGQAQALQAQLHCNPEGLKSLPLGEGLLYLIPVLVRG